MKPLYNYIPKNNKFFEKQQIPTASDVDMPVTSNRMSHPITCFLFEKKSYNIYKILYYNEIVIFSLHY